MSKPWVISLFIGWTAVMVVLAPILLSFSTSNTSTIQTSGIYGLSGIEVRLITKRPLLDWTGRLATTFSEIIWEDTTIYSSVPGRSGVKWNPNMLAKYDVTVGPDGTPAFSKREP